MSEHENRDIRSGFAISDAENGDPRDQSRVRARASLGDSVRGPDHDTEAR